MLRTLVFAFTVLCPVAVAHQNTPFDPLRSRALHSKLGDREVSLVGTSKCAECTSGMRHTIRLTTGKAYRDFELKNETVQIDQLVLTRHGKIVVIGRVLPSTSIVTLLDTASGSVLDMFFCFDPSLSPDGSYISFVKVYPAHFVQGESAQYELYRVAWSAEENRGPGIPVSDFTNVGQPIYPTNALNKSNDNLNLGESDRHHLGSSDFFWLSDQTVVFGDHYSGRLNLVRVALGETIEVSSTPLDITPPKTCLQFEQAGTLVFRISEVVPKDNILEIRISSVSPRCVPDKPLSIESFQRVETLPRWRTHAGLVNSK